MSLFTRKAKQESKATKPIKKAPKIIAPRNLDGRKTVAAPGFSKLELERAGLSERQAEDFGLRIDRDRLSALGDNVSLLKRLLEKA
jgi:ribosomal protein L13E